MDDQLSDGQSPGLFIDIEKKHNEEETDETRINEGLRPAPWPRSCRSTARPDSVSVFSRYLYLLSRTCTNRYLYV